MQTCRLAWRMTANFTSSFHPLRRTHPRLAPSGGSGVERPHQPGRARQGGYGRQRCIAPGPPARATVLPPAELEGAGEPGQRGAEDGLVGLQGWSRPPKLCGIRG